MVSESQAQSEISMTTSFDVFSYAEKLSSAQTSSSVKLGNAPVPTALYLSLPSSSLDSFPFLEMATTLLQDGTFFGPDVPLTSPRVVLNWRYYATTWFVHFHEHNSNSEQAVR